MTTILEHNTDTVYVAGRDGNPVHRPDLESVTFIDSNGSARTVHVPKELGIGDPEAILTAIEHGVTRMAQLRREYERDHVLLTEAEHGKLRAAFEEVLASHGKQQDQSANDQQRQGY